MKLMPVAIISMILFSINCRRPINYYPCDGPGFKERPIPVIRGHLYGLKAGAIDLVFPNGETYHGEWTLAKEDDPAESKWPEAWDKAYGKGFYNKKIANHEIGHFDFKMPNGKKIYTRFRTSCLIPDIEGIALDDQQNTYIISTVILHFEYKDDKLYLVGGK